MSQPAKMSLILPTPVTRAAGLADAREVVRPRGLEREVVPVRRAAVGAGLALERPRDHARDGMLAGQQPARRATRRVELLQRHGPSCAAIWKTESADV